MSKRTGIPKVVMGIAVVMLFVGGLGSLSAGSIDATTIMALSLGSALILLDLAGKPEPRSPRALVGIALLATAVAAALVMLYEMISG